MSLPDIAILPITQIYHQQLSNAGHCRNKSVSILLWRIWYLIFSLVSDSLVRRRGYFAPALYHNIMSCVVINIQQLNYVKCCNEKWLNRRSFTKTRMRLTISNVIVFAVITSFAQAQYGFNIAGNTICINVLYTL